MPGEGTVLKGSYQTSGTLHLSADAQNLTTRGTPQPDQISSWSSFTQLSLLRYQLLQQRVTVRPRTAVSQPAWAQVALGELSLPLPLRCILPSAVSPDQLRLGYYNMPGKLLTTKAMYVYSTHSINVSEGKGDKERL